MTEYKSLGYELSDNVATITINRPEAANSLSLDMCKELMDASIRVDDDPEVRAVVFRRLRAILLHRCRPARVPARQVLRMATYVKEMTTYLHAAVSAIHPDGRATDHRNQRNLRRCGDEPGAVQRPRRGW